MKVLETQMKLSFADNRRVGIVGGAGAFGWLAFLTDSLTGLPIRNHYIKLDKWFCPIEATHCHVLKMEPEHYYPDPNQIMVHFSLDVQCSTLTAT